MSGAAGVDCKMEDVSCKLADGDTAAAPVYQVCITTDLKSRTLEEFRTAQTILHARHNDPEPHACESQQCSEC